MSWMDDSWGKKDKKGKDKEIVPEAVPAQDEDDWTSSWGTSKKDKKSSSKKKQDEEAKAVELATKDAKAAEEAKAAEDAKKKGNRVCYYVTRSFTDIEIRRRRFMGHLR
jgi:hypothetical protein